MHNNTKLYISMTLGGVATLLTPLGLIANLKYGRPDIAMVIVGWQIILNIIAIPLLLNWNKNRS